MKIEYRSFLKSGWARSPLEGRPSVHTSVIPLSDIVLIPHEVGDLAAMWAMIMCMRDSLLRCEEFFPDFVFTDRLTSGGKSIAIEHKSPLVHIDWWVDRLPFLIKLEQETVRDQYVGLVVDVEPAMAAISAIDWFVTRYRCRPPDVSDTTGIPTAKPEEMDMFNPETGSAMSTLQDHEKKSIEAIRLFDSGGFEHMKRFAEVESNLFDDNRRDRDSEVATPESNTVKKPIPQKDEIDEQLSVNVLRAEAPDGYRDEDRRGLNKFRQYVSRLVGDVPPVSARWLESSDLILGQQIFSYSQLIFASSFPNADAARRREEDMKADAERKRREDAAQKMRGQGGVSYA